MENFKKELKKKCESDYVAIKAKNRPKKGKKGSLENMQYALQAFSKLTEKTTEMIMSNTNLLYPQMDVSKEDALHVAQNLTREFLTKIKKDSGF